MCHWAVLDIHCLLNLCFIFLHIVHELAGNRSDWGGEKCQELHCCKTHIIVKHRKFLKETVHEKMNYIFSCENRCINKGVLCCFSTNIHEQHCLVIVFVAYSTHPPLNTSGAGLWHGTWVSRQCWAWVSSNGVGLTLDQSLVDQSHMFWNDIAQCIL